ncbi:hypothetical protein [Janthinobacterium fluminis]|uniref:Type II secretion system protein n=1 Tax=Janthinobacterium fluminis TaxID=2987524 RepID=A0ABT5K5W9_9BURK|nr:hypothetical protein [Janthinobacterium fluminis]MDC8760402.1 hypothetical protein [Janthinobacterium fluminis]
MAAAIVGLVAALVLQRVSFYREQAGHAAMLRVVGDLRTVLHMRAAALYAHGRGNEVAALAARNPMDWLDERPANYRGELDAASAAAAPPDSWYFERDTRRLVYWAGPSQDSDNLDARRLYFKVELLRLPNAPAGLPGVSASGPGVALNQVDE